MAGFTEQLSLDIAPALRDLDRVEDRLGQVGQQLSVNIAKALDLLRDVRLEVEVDTSGLAQQVTAAVNAADTTTQVEADTSGVAQEVSAAVDAADTEAVLELDTAAAQAEVARFVGDTESKFAGLGDVLGAVAFGAGLRGIIDQAGELQQAVGGTEAVFGDFAASVERSASRSAQAFGLSEVEFRNFTTRVGNQLGGLGFQIDEAATKSIQLVQIGADLSATFGGTTADAVEALSAAFRGEFDSVERYVAGLSAASVAARAVELGLADSTSEVDSYAKAQATLSLILENTATAQGQFAREQDTALGQQQRATAEAQDAAAALADQLLPAVTRVTEVVGLLAQAFGALPDSAQTVLVVGAGIVALAGPIASIVTTLGTLAAARAAAAAATSAETAALAANTTALGANAAAIGGVTGLNNLYAASATRAATAANLLKPALLGLAAAFVGVSIAQAGQQNARDAGARIADELDAQLRAADGLEDLEARFADLVAQRNRALEDSQNTLDPFRERDLLAAVSAIDAVIAQYDGLGEVIREVADVQDVDLDQATQITLRGLDQVTVLLSQGYTPAQAAAALATEEAAQAQVEAGPAAEAYSQTYVTVAERVDAATQSLRDYFGLQTSGAEAQIAFRDSLRSIVDLNEQVADGTLTGQERVDRFAQAIIRGRDNALDYAQSLAESGVATDEVARQTNGMIDELFETARQMGLTSSEAEFLRTQYGLLPEQVSTTLATNFDDVLADIESIRLALLNFGGGTLDLQLNDSFGQKATGGPVVAGMPFRGDEGGPGEVFVTRLDGQIVNTAQQAAIQAAYGGRTGSGAVDLDVNIDARGTDPAEVVRRIETRTMFALARMVRT